MAVDIAHYTVYNSSRIQGIEKAHGLPGRSRRCAGISAVVTGGSSGIGFAIVKRLIEEGAKHVIIVSRDAERAVRAIRRLCDALHIKDPPVSYCCNTSSPLHLLTALGRVDFNTLVNCSGLSQSQYLIGGHEDMTQPLWDVNFHLPVRLTKLMVKRYTRLARRTKANEVSISRKPSGKSWSVVNISSLLAVRGGAGSAQYAASKAALNAFTRAITLECRDLWLRSKKVLPLMRLNTILPGYIKTPMTEGK